ncbi:hypothetical protein GPECTOR_68g348 [Gonium pectorale]|uniref:S1 motif domain-containing protein n=1 Tax=Gonium pectorale TaxID=33097 RepID=A0A150G3E7_GONPE|nr:hypothetical protein GPECTOR_68g348 [Gonium pectorale]|eukprot:KXZ44377.1 hypothetical protein GPECTOR_68g348 [Gonium pectorale]
MHGSMASSIGDLVSGRVESIRPTLGAFIDLGSGLTGLVSVRDVSAGAFNNLGEVLAVGHEVKAQVGALVSGVVESLYPGLGAFVDLGPGHLAFLREADVTGALLFFHNGLSGALAVGDSITAQCRAQARRQVKEVNRKAGHVWLSTKVLEPKRGDMAHSAKMVYERAEETWRLRRQKRLKPGELVYGKVTSVEPSGAWVDLGTTLPGFLHASRISSQHVASAADVLAVGDEVTALVRWTEEGSRVILSTKELEPERGDMLRDPKAVYARAEATDRRRRQALPKLGAVVSGLVEHIDPAQRAMIDLGGGLTGLLRNSDVSADPVGDLREVLALGAEVTAQVKGVDSETGCVWLTTSALERAPGDMLRNPSMVYERAEETARTHRPPLPKVGDLVSGLVEFIEPSLGALVNVGPGPLALLRREDVSEMWRELADTHDLEEVLPLGDEVKAQPGKLIYGKVTSVGPSGAWVDLGTTLAGFLHVSRISSGQVASAADVLAEGDEVKALVRYDQQEKRVILSTKELEPQPGTTDLGASDMLRDPKMVYTRAEKTARLRWAALPQARELVSGVVEYIQDKKLAFVDLGCGPLGMMSNWDVSSTPVKDIRTVLSVGDRVAAQVRRLEPETYRVWLNTRFLEPKPGDMLRDPKMVYERSEETAKMTKRPRGQAGKLAMTRNP